MMKFKNDIDDYRLSHMKEEKGEIYDNNFINYKSRSYVWIREKKVLEDIIKIYFTYNNPKHLDIACGTGRIMECLYSHVSSTTGIDISESMLRICRRKMKGAKIIKGDITKSNIVLSEKYDLITAFRFFPNAQDDLRKEAILSLVSLMKDDGYFILNNHKNATNYFYILSWIMKRQRRPMSFIEVRDLLSHANLKIIDCYGIGALLGHEKYLMFPRKFHDIIDYVVDLLGMKEILCQNLIYICQKHK